MHTDFGTKVNLENEALLDIVIVIDITLGLGLCLDRERK